MDESLSGITAKTLLIDLGDKERMKAVDISANGNQLAERLPDADYFEIAPSSHLT